MAGEREFEGETRNKMMQNLFGDQSEEEEDEGDEAEFEREAFPPQRSAYHSEEGEGEIGIEGEGEVDIEGHGEVQTESDEEMHDMDADQRDSKAERVQSSQERDISDQRSESEEKQVESEDHGYGQRVATHKRRGLISSELERSEEDHNFINDEEEEVNQERKASSASEEHDHAVVRDVFGDSDEDEVANYETHDKLEQDLTRSPIENYQKTIGPDDIVPEEDAQYASEDEDAEQKAKEKPVGPPLEMEIPLQRPPGITEKMNMIKVSNIMGIEQKPFDSETYTEEDVFVTDESGAKKRIRLEDNIVRWRSIQNRDGSISYESNARFVKWSDGSLQLLIGNEVLDISVQEGQHDQSHLFLRHGKGILQSQGRLLRKMRFMPSSLSSKSHRLLTALVDSRHKKVYKMKKCVTEIDPEREKEEKEKAEGQSIKANELLQRKREKVSKKYPPSSNRGRQLSPGFLEDEDDEYEDYSSRRHGARHHIEEEMEPESPDEKRILNAKRSRTLKDNSQKQFSSRSSRRPVDEYSESEREQSEYESEGEEIERSPVQRRPLSDNDEYEEQEEEGEEEEEEETGTVNVDSEDEVKEEVPKLNHETGGGGFKRKDFEFDEDESPPRKSVAHRRKTVVFDSDEE